MNLGLRERVYLVTGGSRGLGYATAEALVAEGARVVVSGRDAAAAARAAGTLGPGRAVEPQRNVAMRSGRGGVARFRDLLRRRLQDLAAVGVGLARLGRRQGLERRPAGRAHHVEDEPCVWIERHGRLRVAPGVRR